MPDGDASIRERCDSTLAVLKTTIDVADGSAPDVVDAAKKLQYVIVAKLQSTPPGAEVSDSKYFNLEQALRLFEEKIAAAGLDPSDTPCRPDYNEAMASADGATDKAMCGMAYAACLGARFAEYLSGS
ncbi:MAG: hypothetical protein QGH73_15135 [Rhodospirillales bacterium]|jgi:hypothetical protein|nr:hypothetical protein [Rhodospirillaceae bacterium]MDP6429236.1 hypothetical protein [Rhodospirillales bacterium]MDP6645509.1 hypothetical protein [Rhodospirillales bacterium]MDP6843003.1 hypothetical protein [Rhodospirillales bacterium]|tara:strand:+ start:3035 stop:3418 length:384 start_codon:yes stop_codon:yes gene_type:complete